jgi:hypothetical protein
MANGLGELEMELELEGLGESESEFEGEGEGEFEGEYEAEAFGWGDIKNWASNQWSAVQTPGTWQRKALIAADKAALIGGPTLIGSALGGPAGGTVGGVLGAGLAGALVPDQEFEFENEFESEFEGEFESEFEAEAEGEFEGEGLLNPVNRVYPDAMMEHLGRAAMESESEFEAAEHFLPLIPLVASKLLPIAAKALPKIAGRVLPRVARTISRATPRLTRSVTNLTRTLHRDPRTRPLLRVVPSIARRAVTRIAKHAAAGHRISPRQAVRILARENHRVLRNPRMVGAVLRRSNLMDRRYHRWRGYPLRHLHRRGFRHHPGIGPYPVAGVPARGSHGHPQFGGWGGGGTARFCPTCGTSRMQGVRRVCCCC